MLYECFRDLRRTAATGVDGVNYDDYELSLDSNLADLLERLKSKRYRPQQVRRKLIPKGDGKFRPLGIPALEDKIVQMAARRLLESIFDPHFSENSMGYRPGRSARDASNHLQNRLFFSRVHWIVEADIKGFFDNVDHDWMVRMLKERINDSAFIGLICKFLKAGVLSESGESLHPGAGTPQGGIISPVLANIYLHYVLDLWVEKALPKRYRGRIVYMRYADDFVVGFEYGDEASRFFHELPERMSKFGLELSMEKSGIVRFSRCDTEGSGSFTFLGFDFRWSHTRNGKKTIRRLTNRKKFRGSLSRLKEELMKRRGLRLREIGLYFGQCLAGHRNYYGVIGNSHLLGRFWHAAHGILYRVLNRRSQRKSYSWAQFSQMLKTLDLPACRIVEQQRTIQPNLL